MTQQFEGHSLEEALAAAAEAFGVEQEKITHHVVAEKRGFLGGVKRVVIEAEVNENAVPAEEPLAAAPPAPAPVSPAPPPRNESRGRESRGRGGRGGRGRRERRESDVQPGDFSRFAGEIPEQEEESQGASMVHAWCEQVLSLAKLSAAIRTTEDEERIHVRLYGPDAPRFTEKGGELLDALQVLANKALTGRKVDKDIELDCEDFKQRRVTELGEQAREMADRVRRDGREQLLPSMTPIERRIVHLALQDDSEVTTESRGEGFYKRVAVILRSQAAEVPTGTTSSEP
ncbi:MAG TPA: R3H domain-containing nucleic acid-binding protein [Thermoanaerobaculia bacterium]|jgi:spoIIIJ-associated protein